MTDHQVQMRSTVNQSTYLHHIVDQASEIYARYNDLSVMIPLIYCLALRGVDVCAKDLRGNTCLHLACIRPNAEHLCSHLIRIGVDPRIQNNKGCQVFHEYRNHRCRLSKGKSVTPSGIWESVELEDIDNVHNLLRSWCRVNIYNNEKSLRQTADETSNTSMIHLLDRYETTNELVTAAFACDIELVRRILVETHHSINSRFWLGGNKERLEFYRELTSCSSTKSTARGIANAPIGEVNMDQSDEACEVPKPLIVALSELGAITKGVVEVLLEYGARGDIEEYRQIVSERRKKFNESEFYLMVEVGTDESLTKALELISSGAVDVNLRGEHANSLCVDEVEGNHDKDNMNTEFNWSYLHLIVDRYLRMKSKGIEGRSHLLIRAIYRLALAGIDVNAKDANGRTALVQAASWTGGQCVTETAFKIEQSFIRHLLRIGCDATLSDDHGGTVSEEVYEDRGKLSFSKHYREADLPGLWAAIKQKDLSKTDVWLRTGSRVKVVQGDHTLLEIAGSLCGDTDMAKLIASYTELNEFVSATLASDLKKMLLAISYGESVRKVNAFDDFYHIGFTESRKSEFIRRPLIVDAFELCTPDVIQFLINFGADFSRPYDESSPCGPIAFWTMREHVPNENTLVVLRHADVTMRNELGMTLLHAIVAKRRTDAVKTECIVTLLDHGVDIAARDFEGSTARDYISILKVENGAELQQLLDDYVLELVSTNQLQRLEKLVIDSYHDFSTIQGIGRNKSILEVAEAYRNPQTLRFIGRYNKYKIEMRQLFAAVKEGNIKKASKFSVEKMLASVRDKGGRSLLHLAIVYRHPDLTRYYIENYPHLTKAVDNLKRTPLHYWACHKDHKRRPHVWTSLVEGGADPEALDANNMSAYDYVREMETPTPLNLKPRGRRHINYQPSQVIEQEWNKLYALKANGYALYGLLTTRSWSYADLTKLKLTDILPFDLTLNSLDIDLLKHFIDLKSQDVIIFLINVFHCRPHLVRQILDNQNDSEAVKCFMQLTKELEMRQLTEFLGKLMMMGRMRETTANGLKDSGIVTEFNADELPAKISVEDEVDVLPLMV